MRTIAMGEPLSMARIGSASPVESARSMRSGRELLGQRRARLDEHEVELDILGGEISLA